MGETGDEGDISRDVADGCINLPEGDPHEIPV
jgi:hypothetical protein